MRLIHKMHGLAAIATVGIGALAFSASTATAKIVCNYERDCWHPHADYIYAPSLRLSIHPDNWRFGDREKYRWHEHEGNGYWHHGEWKEF